MQLEDRIQLVKNNTVEVVVEEELNELLKKKESPVTYCGYEPSGELHLGHMVTVTKLMDLEKAGCKVKVLLADWHAWLNRKGTWEEIHETGKVMEAGFIGLGLKKAEYVLGTDFQRSNEYQDDMLTLALNTTVLRAMRSMQEVAREYEHARVSQLIYPLMQIVDIKHLGVEIAQAGIEQRKIHMLAREGLLDINWPKPILVHTPLINSLQGPGKKMSSSVPESFISVRDKPEDIKKKLSKAYCPEAVVENNSVLEIVKLILFPRLKQFEVKRPEKFGGNASFANYAELEKSFAGKKLHPMDLKNAAADYLISILEPVRSACGI